MNTRTYILASIGVGVVTLLLAVVTYESRAPERAAEAQFEECSRADKKCLAVVVGDFALKYGTGAALSLLKRHYPELTVGGSRCFEVAAATGEYMAGKVSDFNSIKLEPESRFCNYGFYQGYSRQWLLDSKDPERLKVFCGMVTKAMSSVSTGATDECYRGMGHALPFINESVQGDIPAMARYALSMCESLAPAGDPRNTCFSGVFSRLGTAELSGLYGLKRDTTGDPMRLCRTVPDTYRSYCEGNLKRSFIDGYVGLKVLTTAIDGYKRTYPKLTRQDLLSASFTIGYDNMFASMPDPDFAAVVQGCADADVQLQAYCIDGMSVGLAKNGTPGSQDAQIEPFCAAVTATFGDAAPACPGDTALKYLKSFFAPAQFNAMCRKLGITGSCVHI